MSSTVRISKTIYTIASTEDSDNYTVYRIKVANKEKTLILTKRWNTYDLSSKTPSGRCGLPKQVKPEFDPQPIAKEPRAPRQKTEAEQCKAQLKAAFPGQKFSVTQSRGSAINVSWVDGPTEKAVEAIANQYQHIRYCEASGEILSGGNTFVFCDREYSRERLMSAINEVAQKWLRWEDREGNKWMTQADLNNVIEGIQDRGGYVVTYKDHCFYDGNRNSFTNEVYQSLKDVDFYGTRTEVKAEAQPEQEIEAVVEIVTEAEVTVTENKELDGVEIRFASKPSDEAIAQLKSNGFRWSRFNKLWYAKNTEENLAFAKSLIVEQPDEVVELVPLALPAAKVEAVVIVESAPVPSYVAVAELPEVKPVEFSAKSPQQELKEKLAVIAIDQLTAEQIYDLLQVLP